MRIDGLVVRQEFGDPATRGESRPIRMADWWLGLFQRDLAHFRDGQTRSIRFKHPQGALVRHSCHSQTDYFAATHFG